MNERAFESTTKIACKFAVNLLLTDALPQQLEGTPSSIIVAVVADVLCTHNIRVTLQACIDDNRAAAAATAKCCFSTLKKKSGCIKLVVHQDEERGDAERNYINTRSSVLELKCH